MEFLFFFHILVQLGVCNEPVPSLVFAGGQGIGFFEDAVKIIETGKANRIGDLADGERMEGQQLQRLAQFDLVDVVSDRHTELLTEEPHNVLLGKPKPSGKGLQSDLRGIVFFNIPRDLDEGGGEMLGIQ